MSNKKLMYRVMKAVDSWLKSDNTFVTDKNGKVIKGGLIDCKKGSLLPLIIKAFEEPTKIECKHLKTFMRGKIITCSDCKKPFY